MRGESKIVVQGDRVALRQPMPGDVREVIAMNRRSKHFQRPWVYAPLDDSGWAAYIERIEGERNHGFLVCLRDTGAIVGVINISEIVRGLFQSGYLGFYAGAQFAGQGYMAEGLKLVLDVGFNRLKLHRLEANIQPENRRSIALVRRLGFRQEGFSPRYLKIGGRWKDHERWAITAEEWRPSRR